MAYTYLFFRPARLPLAANELSADTVLDLADPVAIRAALDQALPAIDWVEEHFGKAVVDGRWIEFHLPAGERKTLSLRCSLRADYQDFVQRLCDQLGWLAFDQQPVCFQPHQAPMPA